MRGLKQQTSLNLQWPRLPPFTPFGFMLDGNCSAENGLVAGGGLYMSLGQGHIDQTGKDSNLLRLFRNLLYWRRAKQEIDTGNC